MKEQRQPISRVPRSRDAARATYDRLSGWYDWIAGASERQYVLMGLEMLNVQPGDSVLEIGYGTGESVLKLAEAVGEFGEVYGVDLSEGMGQVAKQKVFRSGYSERVRLMVADGLDLPFQSASFEALFMSFTLELFDTPEIPRVLKECQRVLKSGGRLCIVAMSKVNGDRWMVQLYEWTHKRMPSLLDCRPIYTAEAIVSAGFQILESKWVTMWGLPVEIVLAQNGQMSSGW